MDGLDALLRADARQWRRDLDDPPDFDSALREVAGRHRFRSRAGLAIVSSAAVILAVSAGGLWLAGRHSSTPDSVGSSTHVPTGVAPTITVHGRTIPYAGEVPWKDAVVSPDGHRIFVTVDRRDIRNGTICGLPVGRPTVQESPHSLTVRVALYALPRKGSEVCPGVAYAPPRRVGATLPDVLGSRALLGADGLPHRVLDPHAVPSLHHVLPSGYSAGPLTWSDKTRVASRTYTDKSCAGGCRVVVSSAPAGTSARLDVEVPVAGVQRQVQVGGRPAVLIIGRNDRIGTVTRVVRWALGDGTRVAVATEGPTSEALRTAETLALARSVR